jgi:hypothetical protein
LVQPTPPKKPPRRNLSVSPTHGGEGGGVSNYEYLFLARSGRNRDSSQYVDMRPRQGLPLQPAGEEVLLLDEVTPRHRRSDSAGEESMRELEPQPTERRHTTIGQYENVNRAHHYPRRKLRRPNEPGGGTGETFVSSAYIRLRPSQENMMEASGDAAAKKKKLQQRPTPLSPTHYQQPPTPDHPPPSAMDAERSIHDRIRPLSQVRPQLFHIQLIDTNT